MKGDSMLNPEIKKLIVEIFASFGEQEKIQAEQEPEVYLVSLLETIKIRLPHHWAMLRSTVKSSGWGSLFEDRPLYPSAKTGLEIIKLESAERERNPPAHSWLPMPDPRKRKKGRAVRKRPVKVNA